MRQFQDQSIDQAAMTLALSRIDYTTVGVTSRGTTIIFPPHEETKQPQKFAVADHDGVLHIYGINILAITIQRCSNE